MEVNGYVSNVVIIAPRERIILVLEPFHKRPLWRIPGGRMEAGESPEQTAIREVTEEIGLIINKDDLEFQKKIKLRGHDRYLYKTRILSHYNLNKRGDDEEIVGIFPIIKIHEIGNLVHSHKIMLLDMFMTK